MKRVNEIGRMVLRGEIPEPELPQGDAKCQSCPLQEPLRQRREALRTPGVGGLTDEEFEAQLRSWIDANARRAQEQLTGVQGEEGSL